MRCAIPSSGQFQEWHTFESIFCCKITFALKQRTCFGRSIKGQVVKSGGKYCVESTLIQTGLGWGLIACAANTYPKQFEYLNSRFNWLFTGIPELSF